MSDRQAVSILRVTDDAGAQLVAACVPHGSEDLLCYGEADSWTESCRPITSVVIDASAILQLTNPKDLYSLSAWLGAAGTWLKVMQIEEREDA